MKYFIILLFCIYSNIVFSQQIPPCGTTSLSNQQEAFLKEFQKGNLQVQPRGTTLYLPLRINIVGTNEGTGYLSPQNILQSICDLNKNFADVSIYFYLDQIKYINNTKFTENGLYNVFVDYSYEAINIFFVEDPIACGQYISITLNDILLRDVILVTNKCADSGRTVLTHEMGHYLSLPHTLKGWEGRSLYNNPIPINEREKVDRSNCTTTGDGFCDTPADYLSTRWNCPYSGPPLFDPNGDIVVPDSSNFMSYSLDKCQYKFSEQQKSAMRTYIHMYKSHMIGNYDTSSFALTLPQTVTPSQGENLTTNEVTFRWNKVPNATNYQLELSQNNLLKYKKDLDIIVSDTFYTFSKLYFNKDYYWRVKAISSDNFCNPNPATSIKTFNTGKERIGVFPNPASKRDKLNVILNVEKNMIGHIEVYSSTGSLVEINAVRLQMGRNNFSIDLTGYSNGMYFIRYKSPEVIISSKFLLID